MRQRIGGFAAVLVAGATLVAPALAQDQKMTAEQQAMMEAYMKAATPGPQHKMLAGTAGTYDMKVKSWMDPSAPPTEDKGTATRSMILGGRIMVEDVDSFMNGNPFKGHGMTGYNNVTARYWATWNDTMGTGLMVMDGICDAQNACAMTGSWDDPLRGKLTARLTTRWTSPTTEVFEMYGPGLDGKEAKMMEITYTKKK